MALQLALASLGATRPNDVLLERVIERHIRGVLDACGGSLALAAELLGVHRRTLERMRHGVPKRRQTKRPLRTAARTAKRRN